MSTIERVTFKISGAYLTHQARSFVLEDNWDYALKFLMESLVGITTDQCLSILKGMKKLVGVNEVDIVDESEEELNLYREQLGFLYHGIVNDGNNYWKPYAYVTSYGPVDVNSPSLSVNRYHSFHTREVPTKLPGTDISFIRWSMARNNYYMDNPVEDKAVLVQDGTEKIAVLFKKVRMPPIWIESIRGYEGYAASFRQYKNQLSERGWLKESWHSNAEDESVKPQENNNFECSEDSLLKIIKQNEDEFEAKLKKYKELVNDSYSKLHDINAICGWVDLNGNIIPCEYADHTKLAFAIVEKSYNDETSTPDDFLVKKGWIKLQNKRFWLSDRNWKVNNSQFKIINNYIELHNLEPEPLLEVK
jgi:hypothetical protein